MGLFKSLSVVGWACRNVFKRFFKGGLWAPFLLLTLIQIIALGLLLTFHQPWSQWGMMPLLKWSGGEGAVHYPYFFSVMPVAFARITLILGILLSSWLIGVATLKFAESFGRKVTDRPWSHAFKFYPHLILLTAVTSVVVFTAFLSQRLVPSDLFLTNSAARWGVRFGTQFLAVVIQAFFIYGVAWIVLKEENFMSAIKSSFSTAKSIFLPTVILVGITAMFQFPLSYVQGRGDLITNKFQPEMMIGIMGVEIFAELILGFVLAGAVTFLFLWKQEGAQ
ncbi:MAG: hypothetical protein HKN21_05990 [Candidatus Eisenbacteria bacterium]|uniref:Uncharacterized protein n=1 Tax=Eiseniibacteriota bacterium TaxID=2212470 RepID=A0A7Y2H1R8_UNCEI|nr:hypothetical protein [Candidatus Eisenbacteria bacterium]